MPYVKEVGTAAATLACAVGIGFLMQSGDTGVSRYGGAQTIANVSQTTPRTRSEEPILKVASITLTSAENNAAVRRPAETVTQVLAPAVAETAEPLADAVVPETCEVQMDASADDLAQINVVLNAPCLPRERLTLHHSGMMITQTTDADGRLSVTLPAMTEEAVVMASFPDGAGAVAQVFVPALADVDRFILQWKGRAGFEMHAREFGAGYGEPGHIWHEAAGESAALRNGDGGYMVRLGDDSAPDALMADVYTFPRSSVNRAGIVDISVEAEVTVYNCGLEIEAQALDLRGGAIRSQDLSLAVSPCDTIGSFLVLNNLVQDLKVASN